MSKVEYVIQALNDSKSVENILSALPEWFGIENAIYNYCEDASTMPTYFAVLGDGTKVGFVCMKFNNEFTAEIHVMGILKEYQGKGIGLALVDYATEMARKRLSEYIMVKTVGSSSSDAHYAKTREFYTKAGFRPLAEFDSIWPGHPCLLMVKKI